MEELINKLGWKKVAVVLVVVSILGLIYVVASYNSVENNASTASKKKIPANNSHANENINREVTNAPSNTSSAPLTKTYITPYYQISYPDNFEAKLFAPSGNIASNVQLIDKASANRIEIAAFTAEPNTMDILAQPYEVNAYIKRPITVNSLKGYEYINSKEKIKINERIAIFPKGQVLIRVLLSYPGLENKDLTNQFNSILQTFQ